MNKLSTLLLATIFIAILSLGIVALVGDFIRKDVYLALNLRNSRNIETEIKNQVRELIHINTDTAVVIVTTIDTAGQRAAGEIEITQNNVRIWWLALYSQDHGLDAKSWKVVATGLSNDLPNCAMVKTLSFSKDMAPFCFDSAQGLMVER